MPDHALSSVLERLLFVELIMSLIVKVCFCEIGDGGSGTGFRQALLWVHNVWLVLTGSPSCLDFFDWDFFFYVYVACLLLHQFLLYMEMTDSYDDIYYSLRSFNENSLFYVFVFFVVGQIQNYVQLDVFVKVSMNM